MTKEKASDKIKRMEEQKRRTKYNNSPNPNNYTNNNYTNHTNLHNLHNIEFSSGYSSAFDSSAFNSSAFNSAFNRGGNQSVCVFQEHFKYD